MPGFPLSPLTSDDMDFLSRLAAKANTHAFRHGYSPLYLALDVGDSGHPDGYMLLCWPALDQKATRCARLIFDYIVDVAQDAYGARLVGVTAEGDDDAPAR